MECRFGRCSSIIDSLTTSYQVYTGTVEAEKTLGSENFVIAFVPSVLSEPLSGASVMSC